MTKELKLYNEKFNIQDVNELLEYFFDKEHEVFTILKGSDKNDKYTFDTIVYAIKEASKREGFTVGQQLIKQHLSDIINPDKILHETSDNHFYMQTLNKKEDG